MASFTAKYGLGEIVFLITDIEQNERMVTQVHFKGNNALVYSLALGMEESDHYEMEISAERDLFKQLDINDKNKQS